MTHIWFAMVVGAVLTAAFRGTMPAVATASVESARAAVELALGLVGVMTFWLGMMRILQEGGLLRSIAAGLRPVLRRLFPEVPPEHPAMSAMVMNLASNVLGLGNAATPFGIRAMQALESINPMRGVASNAQVLFLAINTSGVAVAPLGVIALRASLGSENAGAIWVPTLIATSCSTAVAIVAAKLLQRWVPAKPLAGAGANAIAIDPEPEVEAAASDTSPGGCLLALGLVAALAAAIGFEVYRGVTTGDGLGGVVRELLQSWVLPILIVATLAYGMARRVDVYAAAVRGGRDGFDAALRIIPFLVAILVAVGMLRASGALDVIIAALRPITEPLGFPAEALPMALLRPLSGSGAYAVLAETLKTHGPDSHVGYLVSVLQGSTETTFYVIAVYFGAAGVTRLRHAVAAGLLADLAGAIGATLAVRWLLV